MKTRTWPHLGCGSDRGSSGGIAALGMGGTQKYGSCASENLVSPLETGKQGGKTREWGIRPMGGGGALLGRPVACWGVDRHSVQQRRLVPFGPHLFPIPADEGSFVCGYSSRAVPVCGFFSFPHPAFEFRIRESHFVCSQPRVFEVMTAKDDEKRQDGAAEVPEVKESVSATLSLKEASPASPSFRTATSTLASFFC